MEHEVTPSPDHALLQFVERLPLTIREVILAHCCMAFGRLQTESQDVQATFSAILRRAEGVAPAYSCAKMAAVIELALEMEEFDHDVCESTGSHRFDIDMQAPLTRKHWQAARTEFQALRGGALSVRSLHTMLKEYGEDHRSQHRSG